MNEIVDKNKIGDSIIGRLDKDNKALGFVFKAMVSSSLPHSSCTQPYYFQESNNYKIEISGGSDGIPYGVYPRLLLIWIITQVCKQKSREISINHTISSLMKTLGLKVSGGKTGSIKPFSDQLKRLFSSKISFTYKNKGKWFNVNLIVTSRAELYWDEASPELNLSQSKIIVSEDFYSEAIKSPVPLSLSAINQLKTSSLGLDIYMWLTHKASFLNKTIYISFDALKLQFGGSYGNTSKAKYKFKTNFIIQLEKVKKIYTAINFNIQDKGIFISPSKTHVERFSKSKVLEDHNNVAKYDFPVLDSETYTIAKKLIPEYDIYEIEQEWLSFWNKNGRMTLKNPDKAFIGFCKKLKKTNS